METTTKEQILKMIRNALMDKPLNPFKDIDFDTDILNEFTDDPAVVFAKQFVEEGGQFAYLESKKEAEEYIQALLKEKHWEVIQREESKILTVGTPPNILSKASAWVVDAEALVARDARILVASKTLSADYKEIAALIVVAEYSSVVKDISDALKKTKEKYDKLPALLSFLKKGESNITKEIYVVLIDE
jgi:L-lactate utilization protein LutC